MYWLVDRVLPGLIDGVPYLAIGGAGLWLNWKATKRHVDRVTRQQTEELVKTVEERKW